MAETHIDVDHDLCYGAQNCMLVAPGAFDLNDENKSVVADPSQATPEQLRAAEAQCPGMAITIHSIAGES